MLMEERHQKILEIINRDYSIKARDISELFDIGFDTARRDLRILEDKGLLKRTHGGAIKIKPRGFRKPKFHTAKDVKHVKENYMKIALEACKLIKPLEVVYITSGTVGYFMTKHLPRDIEYTVVTNSIVVADEIRTFENITIVLIGGVMNSKGTTKEYFATEMIKSMRLDKAFITSGGFSSDFGMSISESKSVSLIQTLMASSKVIIGLYPHEKIGIDFMAKISDADELDILITDWETCEDEVIKIREKNVEVLVVDEEI